MGRGLVKAPHRSVWEGKSVRIRGCEPDDWQYFSRFEEDSADARSVFRVIPPRSQDSYRRQAADLASKPEDEIRFAALVEHRVSGDVIGAISTLDADERAGRFKYGLAIDRDHRRRGHATEAARLVLRYMFDERRFHKCEVDIYTFNTASLAMHEKLGFVREGCLREHEYFGGRHWDVVVMGLTVDEFRARHPSETLPLR